jgi:hypothetical protein
LPRPDSRLVFLDANVLARPVTRTLLLVGADPAGFRVVWSRQAEDEANRHLRQRTLSVTELRHLLDRELGPSGDDPSRFRDTDRKDRQILADVEAAGAGFLVTADVGDFGQADLVRLKLAAVHPDLFMATCYPLDAYRNAIIQMAARMNNPHRTGEQLHSLIARQHPLLFAAHAAAFPSDPAPSPDEPPTVTYRGVRCLVCGLASDDAGSLHHGIGPECRAT